MPFRQVCSSYDGASYNIWLWSLPVYYSFYCYIIVQHPLRLPYYSWNGLHPLEKPHSHLEVCLCKNAIALFTPGPFSRINNVLNLLAIYAINCGTLNLWASALISINYLFLTFALFCRVFAISCIILVVFTFALCVFLSKLTPCPYPEQSMPRIKMCS